MGLYDQKENYLESSDIFGSSMESFCSKGKDKHVIRKQNPVVKHKFKPLKKKIIFNKKNDLQFDEDVFGKLGAELDDDSSFDISMDDSTSKKITKRDKKESK